MLSKTVRRPSPALIVAIVALVAALAGTAVALPGKNTVKSNDIAKNAVRSSDVKNDSLKGKDINESKLGKVPSAATADVAASLAGHTRISQFVGAGEHNLATFGPFTLVGSCVIDDTGVDTATLLITTSADNSAYSGDNDGDADFDVADSPLEVDSVSIGTTGDPVTNTPEDSFVAIAPDGATFTSGDYFAAINVGGQAGQCYFGGTFDQLR